MKKNYRKLTAAAGAGLLLAVSLFAQSGIAQNASAEQEDRVSLAIADAKGTEEEIVEEAPEKITLSTSGAAGDAEEDPEAPGETETEAPAEEETEAVNYDPLKTTSVGDAEIVAVDVSAIVDEIMPSIVAITSTSVQEIQDFFYGYQEYEAVGAGSGVIIAESADELMIATNNHVIEGSKDLTVCFTVDVEDEEDLIVPAVEKGTDAKYDLAVVAVKKADIPEEVYSQLRIATLGSSSDIKVGEPALVIGNALGVGQTVTSGIISALEREVITENGKYTEMQTDAAINLGCSGGAVINRNGEVIGIASAKAVGDYAESMGYAIPIDTAIPVLDGLINLETRSSLTKHGYLGITVVPISDEAQEMYSMPAGAFVYEVPEGSAGEAAGLRNGDIITSFDGRAIDSSDKLVSTVALYEPGETVTLEVQSAENGTYVTREVEVTLQEGSPDAEEEELVEDDKDGKKDPAPDDRDQYNRRGGEEGEEDYGTFPYDDGGNSWFDWFFGNGGNGNGFGF